VDDLVEDDSRGGVSRLDLRQRRVERSARIWLRAYPRRWRSSYGEDLVGTLLDLAGPDARTVRLRDGLSVLWAGWSLRLREHPPLLPWLGYRFFEMRLAQRYRAWVADDVLGRLFAVRSVLIYTACLALLYVGWALLFSDPVPSLQGDPWFYAMVWGAPALSSLLYPRFIPRRIWRRQVSAWVPPELRPRSSPGDPARELAEYRAASMQRQAGPAGRPEASHG